MKVEAAVFQYKRALMGNKESTLPGLMKTWMFERRFQLFGFNESVLQVCHVRVIFDCVRETSQVFLISVNRAR